MSQTPYGRYGINPETGKPYTAKEKLDALQTEYATGKTGLTDKEYGDLRKNIYEAEYGPGFDMGEFEGLLGKLEASKMRQQRQKSVEGRRDIMTGGLAGMMSNF